MRDIFDLKIVVQQMMLFKIAKVSTFTGLAGASAGRNLDPARSLLKALLRGVFEIQMFAERTDLVLPIRLPRNWPQTSLKLQGL